MHANNTLKNCYVTSKQQPHKNNCSLDLHGEIEDYAGKPMQAWIELHYYFHECP
jgi:hypothetical protein